MQTLFNLQTMFKIVYRDLLLDVCSLLGINEAVVTIHQQRMKYLPYLCVQMLSHLDSQAALECIPVEVRETFF